MLAAFASGTALDVPESYVQLINGLQVTQSSQFLYAAASVKEWVEANFDPTVVRSLFHLGGLGEGPPRLERMPSGAFLIVERGTNHRALPVTNLSENTGNFVVATTDLVKLALIQADSPFDSVRLVVDGHEIQGAREVMFEVTPRDGEVLLTIRHTDAGLESFIEHLRFQRGSNKGCRN